ncbi:MAG: hypothetical protein B6D55_01190 [Candidatus Omnitrophica bacterium 4484_70.2]|nr:MAG: hypothetical protein B6D55_01190 [Candidatus Omnitrophica bacterium 4484_70.2]
MKNKKENLRLYLVYIGFLFFFIGIFSRIAYLQIIKRNFLQQVARKEHIKLIPLQGERGRIFDRKGRILATNINVFSLYADPKNIEDIGKIERILSEELEIDKKEIKRKLTRNSRFVWLKRKISLEGKERINKLIKKFKLKGIYFCREKERFYPQGKILSHILGGVNIDNQGIEGIELFYNNYLKAKNGWVEVTRDTTSEGVFLSPQVVSPINGADIFLTIDIQIQYWAETYLKETIEKFDAQAGGVVVVDPFSGEILALANYPSYDSNRISEFPHDSIRNRVITDVFEPGSVFKLVTLIAAIEEGKFNRDDIIFCEHGKFKIPGSVLHDWKPFGKLKFEEVFEKSSNIGVAKIANKLGKDIIYKFIRELGFGETTGVDLPGEIGGFLKPKHVWSKTSGYIIPIGQEVGVTLLQLVRAFCVPANGGYLVRPYVVKKIFREGFLHQTKPQRRKVIPSSVANKVKEILGEVVREGTGRLANIEGIKVGGKTGTAQVYDPQLRRYSPTHYRASFVGFLPLEHPRLVIGVSIDNPQKSHFGGVIAAPLFKKIGEKAIKYLEEREIVKR